MIPAMPSATNKPPLKTLNFGMSNFGQKVEAKTNEHITHCAII